MMNLLVSRREDVDKDGDEDRRIVLVGRAGIQSQHEYRLPEIDKDKIRLNKIRGAFETTKLISPIVIVAVKDEAVLGSVVGRNLAEVRDSGRRKHPLGSSTTEFLILS
jgi:hypothetical protein